MSRLRVKLLDRTLIEVDGQEAGLTPITGAVQARLVIAKAERSAETGRAPAHRVGAGPHPPGVKREAAHHYQRVLRGPVEGTISLRRTARGHQARFAGEDQHARGGQVRP